MWKVLYTGAGGYYRFTLPPADLKALLTALPQLSAVEQLAVLDAVGAGFALGKADVNAVLDAAAATSASPHATVVGKLWGRINFDAAGREQLRARLGAIYQPAFARLGVQPKTGESANDVELRSALLKYLAVDHQVPAVRDAVLAAAKPVFDAPGERLALKGLSEDLLAPALTVWARAGGAQAAARLQKELTLNQDPAQRSAVLGALASISDPAIATAVRDLTLTPQLQLREMTAVLGTQADQQVLDENFWPWYQANFATLLQRMPAMAQGRLVEEGTRNRCDRRDIAPFQQFISGKIASIANGPRALQQATEGIGLCAALAQHHAGSKIAASANP